MAEVPRQINEVAFRRLLLAKADRLRGQVRRKIPAHLKSTISVEDVIQETWIGVFRAIPEFTPQEVDAFDRLLTRIMERKVIDALRRVQTAKRGGRMNRLHPNATTSFMNLYSRITGDQRTPSSEDAAMEAVSAVQIALCSLPANYRCAMVMFHIEGHSRPEIATLMSKSVAAVNGLLYRGLGMLRRQLGSPGRYFSDAAPAGKI